MIESASEFVRLRHSKNRQEYMRAALEPASLEVWKQVIVEYPDMRVMVAVNKTIPIEVLRILAKDSDVAVRCAVAAKRKLDRDLFWDLSRDPSEEVRYKIAWNRKTPPDVLKKLSMDESEIVVRAVAQRS